MSEQKMATNKEGINIIQYFVLLHDRNGQKHEKSYFTSTKDMKKFVSLGKGEIITKKMPEKTPDMLSMQQFYVMDRPGVYVECCLNEVKQIDEEEALLLLPLCSLSDRLRLVEEGKALKYGKKATIGSTVYVKISSRSVVQSARQDFIEGIIRYKGPLDEKVGTMFGVEIVETTGKGFTSGYFKGKRYFECPVDCGVFVSLEKLKFHCDSSRMDKNKVETKEVNGVTENSGGLIDMVKKFWMGEPTSFKDHGGHKLDDSVWVYIEHEKPQRGVIKYIGYVPDEKYRKQIFAGIFLDHNTGMGNGNYNGKQLFTCPMDHANFTPIENVISREKFSQFFEAQGTPKSSALKNKSSSTPQTSEDIVNMESKFSNQSKDQVIKEQEQFLKQIKKDELKTSEKRNCDNSSRAGIGTSLGSSKNEDRTTKLDNHEVSHSNHVSHANIQVNGDQRNQTPNNYPQLENTPLQSNMDIGSMVEVLSKNQKPQYGLIRWLGFVPNSDKKIAGLELEEELDACTDGTFLNKRYFTCPSRRGFFVHLHNCLPDSRFNKNSIENAASKRLTGTDFGPYHSEIIEHDLIPPPETLQVYLAEEARGIQGHHNSCYLDATLFAAFAFSSVMDSILLRPRKTADIEEYEKVQTVLRNNIIYPLRDSGFVRADRVLELRELLDRLGTVTGLVGEEKDPEEFLLTLLQQVLKTEPFLKIRSGKEVHNEYFYQVLADKDVERVLPSVEELLKKSFHQSDLKLTEVPSCLVVQMPRFGKQFKMYDRILPSLTINIGELVDNNPQDCTVCGRLAWFHCRECFNVTGSQDTDSSGNFCKDCNTRVHSHVKRAKHNRVPITVPRKICDSYANMPVEHREMDLFAVICIETSHYVTFAKCEEPNGDARWCFFDSMADRVGTKNGYNVPSVTECPEIIEWLSSEKQNRERIINTNDKEMPDRVRRILGDAYVCLYQSKEMAMYK